MTRARWRWRVRRRWRRVRPMVEAGLLVAFWISVTLGFWYVLARAIRPAFGQPVSEWVTVNTTTTTTVPVRCGACPAIPRCPDCVLIPPLERCRVLRTRLDRPGWRKEIRLCPVP